MKILRYMLMIMLLPAICASEAVADVNEVLTFTNYTDEEIYVELQIFDDSGGRIYDVYVLPNGTSIADYWADTSFAFYSACAFGEITGDFYGCIDGGITDYYNNIYFDFSAEPYLYTPSDLPYELFVFENPYRKEADVIVIETDDHHDSGGCFVGVLSGD